MTYSKAKQRGKGYQRQPRTLLEAYSLEADRLCEVLGVDGKWKWPNPEYRENPRRFVTEVLGLPVWDRMGELLDAMVCHKRVAVCAGRKVSKSLTDAVIALWWWSSYYDAKVVMTSTTARQVDAILWEEVRKLHGRSQHAPMLDGFDISAGPESGIEAWPTGTRALDGEPMFLARSGLASGFRSIAGFTAREGVAAAGVSGANQLWIVDEASGVSDQIFDAIIGNMAGGGRLLITGNPTESEGELFDAFHSKKYDPVTNPRGYYAMRISSAESPNVRAGKTVIPGMAERDWLDERKTEWGTDSAQYQIHVEGKFVTVETGKILSLQKIKEAEDRWKASGESAVHAVGVLHIGIDPALSEDNDESVFVARRGPRVIAMRAFRGLNEAGHVKALDDLLKEYREPGEIAIVNLDALGDVGAKVKVELTIYWRQHENEMILCCLRGSDIAQRNPTGYVRCRDELWGSLEEWIRDGGAIPEHVKLARDLHSVSWESGDLKQRKQATKKDAIKRLIGRSPDYGDALCLAVWDNTKAAEWAKSSAQPQQTQKQGAWEPSQLDPYAGADYWKGA